MLSQKNMLKLQRYIRERSIEVSWSGCWLWLLSDGSHGYPQGSMPAVTGERVSLAHRMSYLAWHGQIPAGYDIDHLCRVRACVNPAHLEAVTQFANRRRQFGHEADADMHEPDTCPRGHDDYFRSETTGKMTCRECHRTNRAA